jgi:hypothetical protein
MMIRWIVEQLNRLTNVIGKGNHAVQELGANSATSSRPYSFKVNRHQVSSDFIPDTSLKSRLNLNVGNFGAHFNVWPQRNGGCDYFLPAQGLFAAQGLFLPAQGLLAAQGFVFSVVAVPLVGVFAPQGFAPQPTTKPIPKTLAIAK